MVSFGHPVHHQDAKEKPLLYTLNNSVYVQSVYDQSGGNIPEKSPSTDQRTHCTMKKYTNMNI